MSAPANGSTSTLLHTTTATTDNDSRRAYIGRFAPSPTGPLHFGSLVSAVASYVHARHAGGHWLVRMENLDPPREQPGAEALILDALQAHGLIWDGEVRYQSERLEAYAHTLNQLHVQQLAYRCRCTRKDVKAMGGVYDGRCRTAEVPEHEPHAWRMKVYGLADNDDTVQFEDLIQGLQTQNLRSEVGDPIIKRKDGLFAYQLAVVVDDIDQGVSHIIRGGDLLEVSACQLAMFHLLGAKPPSLGHVPVATNPSGQKLSKQHHAPALNTERANANLWHALQFLGQNPPNELSDESPTEILNWAKAHWRTAAITGLSGATPEQQLTLHNVDSNDSGER